MSRVKRASLVIKNPKKTSRVVIGDDELSSTEGFRKRVLLSLVLDVVELRETVERLQICVFTLAKEDGINIPE